MSKNHIVVLGLGNPILTDDAVGLRVVNALEKMFEQSPVPGVDVLQSTRAGFELIDLLRGYEIAVIIDAFQADNPEPGKVRRISMDDIVGNARLNAVHEINIKTAFDLAEKLGVSMPDRVEIFAVEVDDVYTFSEEMTPPVAAVVKPLAGELLDYLKELARTLPDNHCETDDHSDDGNKSPRPFYSP